MKKVVIQIIVGILIFALGWLNGWSMCDLFT